MFRSFDWRAPSLLLIHSLHINMQVSKQREGSLLLLQSQPCLCRHLVCKIGCLIVCKSAREHFLGMSWGPWTGCELFYNKMSTSANLLEIEKIYARFGETSGYFYVQCVSHNSCCSTFMCSKLSRLSHIQVVEIMHCYLLYWLWISEEEHYFKNFTDSCHIRFLLCFDALIVWFMNTEKYS